MTGHDEARHQITRAVSDLTDGFGDPRSPAYGPLTALRALHQLRMALTTAEREAARRAREAGSSWTDIGEAYGFADNPGLGMTSVPGRAFLAFASDLGSGPVVTWTCPACTRTVIDTGPEGHPADQEQGHGAGCTRLAATIRAWGDEDD